VSGTRRRGRLVAGVVLPLLVAVALLVLLVWLSGTAAVLGTLAHIGAWQGLALVAAAFSSTVFTALGLRVILRRYGHSVSAWLLFRLSILAFAVGWLVPSGYAAGFPVAAWLLRRRGVPFDRGLAAFLIQRAFELSAYAIVLPTVLLGGLGSSLGLLVGVFSPIAGVLLLALDLGLGWRLGRRGLGALAVRAPGFAAPVVARAIDFCATVASFFRGSLAVVLLAVLLSVLSIAASFGRAVLTARFLELPLGLAQVALLVAFSLVVLALPLLPGAIGIYEGGMVGFFRLLGHPQADGLAYAMAVHGVELVVAAAGLAFLAQLGVDLATAEEIAAAPPEAGPSVAP
jgi:glycosyltransferase 2 family protein